MNKLATFKRAILSGGIVLTAAVLILALVATQGPANAVTAASPTDPDASAPGAVIPQPARVELKVEGMTCSGCIFTIKSSLADIQGIADVQVDIAAGRADVTYDPAKLDNVSRLAEAITASGYTASVTRVISAEQLDRERKQASERSRLVIASVGGIEVSRADFEKDLTHAQARYKATYGESVFEDQKGKTLLDRLKAQIASRLIDTTIQVHEVKKAGFTVSEPMVAREYQSFLESRGMSNDDFQASLQENNYIYDDFMKTFKTRVLIGAYFDQEVAPGMTNKAEKESRYAEWFDNARLMTDVVVYDGEINNLIQAQKAGGGCGRNTGGGCGSNCSSSR